MIQLPLEKLSLPFAVVVFECQAVDPIYFNKYPGFVVRSGLGFALHHLCRNKSRIPCHLCDINHLCPYAYIFETPSREGKPVDFTAEYVPHPFVLFTPLGEKRELGRGELFHIQFTLFGSGIPYLLFYIYAVDLLSEKGLGPTRGRFLLQRVVDAHSKKQLYSIKDKTLSADPDIRDVTGFTSAEDMDRCQLQFVSPAKILTRNKPARSLTPDIFIKRLLGRGKLLAELHTETSWQFDYERLIKEFISDVSLDHSDLQSFILEAYSRRQRREQRYDTLVGSVTYRGRISGYWPLFKLGEIIHLGNSTSKGLGKYVVTSSPVSGQTVKV